MRTLAFVLALTAGAAGAQQPATPQPEKQPRPLNLRIDDEQPRAAPRVTFDTKDDKAATSNLPGLGAGARSIDKQPSRPGSSGSPYPADTNPNLR